MHAANQRGSCQTQHSTAVSTCSINYLQDSETRWPVQELTIPCSRDQQAVDSVQHLLCTAYKQDFHATAAVGLFSLPLHFLLSALLPLYSHVVCLCCTTKCRRASNYVCQTQASVLRSHQLNTVSSALTFSSTDAVQNKQPNAFETYLSRCQRSYTCPCRSLASCQNCCRE